jgi:hypothetical protein
MDGRMFRYVVLLLSLPSLLSVHVPQQTQTIYDRTVYLRIKCFGFDDPDITLDLSASGEDSLRMNTDYILSTSQDGIVLKLLHTRK